MSERSVAYRLAVSAITIAAVVFMSGCIGVFFNQSKLVFHPHSDIAMRPSQAGLEYEDLRLSPAPDAFINAWYVPAEGARRTVIFCHGNGENIGDDLDYIILYHELGANLLIFDYRGYGRSSGKPSEKATYEDMTACWKYVTEERGTPPGEIVLAGRSLGGAVAANLASRVTPAGLILESTFTSVPDMGREIFPLLPIRLMARIHYDTKAILPSVKCPVLILHSRRDEVIPFHHSERLFEIANEPKRFVEIEATHNDSPLEKGEALREAIGDFIAGRWPPANR